MLLWRCYIVLCFMLLLYVFNGERPGPPSLSSIEDIETSLVGLENTCLDSGLQHGGVTFVLCHAQSFSRVVFDSSGYKVMDSTLLGHFQQKESQADIHVFKSNSTQCNRDGLTFINESRTTVHFECCAESAEVLGKLFRNPTVAYGQVPFPHGETYFSEISPVGHCDFRVVVCSSLLCSDTLNLKEEEVRTRQLERDNVEITSEEQHRLKERARDIFYHAYRAYLNNGFPEGELRPIACEGGPFDLIKIPLVTLIDVLDTLVVLGDHAEFRNAVTLVKQHMPRFDFDVNVSVFETTIRLLGGLLSGHLLAIDPRLKIYDQVKDKYNSELLALAVDLGDRLLVAFDTKTGIPYGTVNLRYGVPKGETKIASTAGAGSLLLEFQILSHLTGDDRYGIAAFAATEALYNRRSTIDLLGKHINTETGQWQETVSGVGSNSDSFYEYLLKSYSLFRDRNLYKMFGVTYSAIKKYILMDDSWFTEVDMFSGKLQRQRVENLDAFWPGVETSLGKFQSASLQLNAFYSIWKDLGFLPEELEYSQWQNGKGAGNPYYPLRPELVESTYHQYHSTADRKWLIAGRLFLESIDNFTRTGCGYASVSNMATMELQDSMPSFFLSETCKYMYLLFDENNFLHNKASIFSTEAHPFDGVLISQVRNFVKETQGGGDMNDRLQEFEHRKKASTKSVKDRSRRRGRHGNKLARDSKEVDSTKEQATSVDSHSLLLTCAKKVWWDEMSTYATSSQLKSDPATDHRKYKQSKRKKYTIFDHTVRRSLRAQKNLNSVYSRLHNMDMSKLKQRSVSQNPSEITAKKCGLDAEHSEASTRPRVGTNHPTDGAVASEDPSVIKTVDLNVGALGNFNIKVLADGFRISNKQDSRGLEISNVGKNVIFLRQTVAEKLFSVIGLPQGATSSCMVKLFKNYSDGSVEQLWQRPCSTANFGLKPPFSFDAEVAIAPPADVALCGNAKGDVKAKISQIVRSWWWNKFTDKLSPRAIGNPNYHDMQGKIVLAERGGCMFEEKAIVAQAAGCSGLIIQNNENNLFIMAGKKDVENEMASEIPTSKLDIQANIDPIAIPVVMISQADGKELQNFFFSEDVNGADSQLLLRTVVDNKHSMFTSEFMGNVDYPKIWMNKHSIYAVTDGLWGAYFKSQSGDDWQMYLIDKRDITASQLIPAISLRSAAGMKLSTSIMLAQHTSGLYLQHFKRKCPKSLKVTVSNSKLVLTNEL